MKNIYLHIGYPKTATTTLQARLFSQHPELIYLRSKEKQLNFVSDVFFARENFVKRNIRNIKNELLKNTNCCRSGKFVYSEESLLSFSMFFRFNPAPYIWMVEPNSVARKLHVSFSDTGVFDSVKIIVTIRKQDEMLKSMYAQVYNLVFKRFRETCNFKKFLNYSLLESPANGIIDTLHYNDIIGEYESLFGKGNICVLVFEELKKDKEKYIKKLSDFMGIDNGISLSLIGSSNLNSRSSCERYRTDERSLLELAAHYKRVLCGDKSFGRSGSFFTKALRKVYIKGRDLKGVEICDRHKEELQGQYAIGNNLLSQRYNLELKKYGYYCG